MRASDLDTDDGLRFVRGFVNAVLLSVPLWLIGALLIWKVLR